VATRAANGTDAILVWNGTVDVTKSGGDALLDRHLELTVTGLGAAPRLLRHRRLDERHSNINAAWARIGAGRDWPDDAGWRALRDEDLLADLEPPRYVRAEAGALRLSFDLPMPSLSLVELHPDETRSPD
jgi:xylan 1,4-beta-xylosidase